MWRRITREWKHNWIMYLMMLPVFVYFVVYEYGPMYGIIIAFNDYNVKKGI